VYKDPTIEDPYSYNGDINSVAVYPSPVAKGQETWAYITSVGKGAVTLKVVDDKGNTVASQTLKGRKIYVVLLQTASYASGIYWVELTTASSKVSYPFTVKEG